MDHFPNIFCITEAQFSLYSSLRKWEKTLAVVLILQFHKKRCVPKRQGYKTGIKSFLVKKKIRPPYPQFINFSPAAPLNLTVNEVPIYKIFTSGAPSISVNELPIYIFLACGAASI